MSTRSDHNYKTVEQYSAGGVAVRETEGEINITIIHMLPDLRWQLPKGVIDPGETAQIAALREVREEAGIDCELAGHIRQIEYWFTADRDGKTLRIHKYVDFFLMHYLSGDVADHDHEVAESRWVTIDEALRMLVFESEREVVRKGIEKYRAATVAASN